MQRKPLSVGRRALATLMEKIGCLGGHTRIGRGAQHARAENTRLKVQAFVFIGDAMEETPSDLYDAARGLGLPMFLFPGRRRSDRNKSVPRDRAADRGCALPV